MRVDAEYETWAYTFAAGCRAVGVKKLPQAGRYAGKRSSLSTFFEVLFRD